MKKQRFYDRHWGGIGLTLAVVLLMCAASVFAATPPATNNANGVSEVTATNDEVVARSTSAVVPLAAAPNLGADSATTVDNAGITNSPPTSLFQWNASDAALPAASDGAASYIMTSSTSPANIGGANDAGATSASAANSTASTPGGTATVTTSTWEVWRGSAPIHPTGNNFGHTQ